MKKIFLFLILLLSAGSIIFAQSTGAIDSTDPNIFYDQVRAGAIGPECLQIQGSALDRVNNCLVAIANALKPIAAILFTIAITISGAYLIFSPANKGLTEKAKAILIWSTVGFVLVFGYDIIKGLIEYLAG